jgi:hypothetical protein
MNVDARRLERRYRWLLLAYPRAYREATEQELLWVLLASAAEGQGWPTLADTADLLRCGVLERVRTWRQPAGEPCWRDGLALFSLAAPVVLLIPILVVILRAGNAGWLPLLRAGLIAVPVLLGWRRIALAMVVLSVCCNAVLAGALLGIASWRFTWIYFGAPTQGLYLTFWLLEGIALIWSAGPRRGRQLLTWPGAVSLILIGALLGVFWTGTGTALTELTVGIAALVVLAVSSRPGRYVAALVVLMLYPYALSFATIALRQSPDHLVLMPPGWLALMYLPEVAVASMIVVAAMRSRHGGTSAQPDPPAGAGD